MSFSPVTSQVEHRQVGWSFWFRWVLASSVGFALGASLVLFFAFIGLISVGDVLVSALGQVTLLVFLVLFIVLFAVFGALVGVAQWLVLRQQVQRAGGWVLASMVGVALGGPLAYTLGFFVMLAVASALGNSVGVAVLFAMIGAVVGIMQWLVLRQQVHRAGGWVLASTLGWAVLGRVLYAANTLAGSMPATDEFVSYLIMAFGLAAVGGLAVGAITGVALVWLLRQPIRAG